MSMLDWQQYPAGAFYDELVAPGGTPRQAARTLCEHLGKLSDAELTERRTAAELAISVMGITFTVYSEGNMIDRAWPFDIVPRIIPLTEWTRIEAGLKQRVQALNLFIDDLYHEQKVIRDGILPAEILAQSVNFRPQCVGITPPHRVWAHICGSDLVRDKDGTVYVLEDNLRVPSGVSYMLENRSAMQQLFPSLFHRQRVASIEHYPDQLLAALRCGLAHRGQAHGKRRGACGHRQGGATLQKGPAGGIVRRQLREVVHGRPALFLHDEFGRRQHQGQRGLDAPQGVGLVAGGQGGDG